MGNLNKKMSAVLMGSLEKKLSVIGVVPLSFATARELSAGAPINAAGNGGLLASDTTPAVSIVSGGSRLSWAATNVDVLRWSFQAPADVNVSAPVIVKILASMAATNDTPVLTVGFYVGQSNSDLGGATTAVSGTTPTVKTRSITATAGNQWSITLTPAAHGTDILRVDSMWIEYTRK